MTTKKLRIVIVVSYAYPFIESGLSKVATTQAENLSRLGHEVYLVSSRKMSKKKAFKHKQVTYIKLNSIELPKKYEIPVPFFLLNLQVIQLIKTADVINVHEIFYPSSFQAVLWAKIYRKPVVLTQHAGFIKYSNMLINIMMSLIKNTMGRLILAWSNKVLVVNEEVGRWLNMDTKKISTLVNGVDTELFHPVDNDTRLKLRKKYKLPTDRKIVLFVGRFVEKKGYLELYESRDKSYLLIFVGNGDIAKEMKLDSSKAIFFNAMPHEKLREFYQMADVFVLPSWCEGFPLTIQEAMASGLPIVSTKHPGFDKYLDNKYIEYVKPNKSSIKEVLIKLTGNKDRLLAMGAYSRRTALSNYSWEDNAEKLSFIFYQLSK